MLTDTYNPPTCSCDKRELRRRQLGNGAVIVGYQCLGCGRSVERIAKKDLRRRVFLRCQGICEGCGERRAAQVHHLTYERLGDGPHGSEGGDVL